MNVARPLYSAFLLLLSLAACRTGPDPADVRRELLEADRAFAEATAREGVDGWTERFAADGAMYLPAAVVRGHQAIQDLMAPALADSTRRLVWEPVEAVGAPDGQFGYTAGRHRTLTVPGDSVVRSGTYLTVWRLTPDGWRVVADIGNLDPVPSP